MLNPANNQLVPFTTVTGGANNNGTMEFNTGRGAGDTLGQIDFPAPGDYPIQVLYFEGDGGSSVEVFSSPGAKTAFDGEFGLIGGQATTVNRRFGQVGAWNTYTFGGLSGMAATIAAYNNGNPAAGSFRGAAPLRGYDRLHSP